MAASNERLIVIGNFDGVHRGHQAVLVDAEREATTRGLEAALLTFDPHPAVVLGRKAPPRLTSLARKLDLVTRTAQITTIVERFDLAFAALSPDAFAREVLRARLHARAVTVGENFRFGKDRAGDFDALVDLGKRHGFETRSHPLVGDARGPWSSTRIRQAIALGEVEAAAAMLGRPHMISGVVVKGDQRGRTIGFPTANLGDVDEALPPHGVYAVVVDRVEGGVARALAKGVMNLGVRPTVKEAGAAPTIEAHLFDVDLDLYDARLEVHVVKRLRGEVKLAGLDALRAQIARDVEAARAATRAIEHGPRGAFG